MGRNRVELIFFVDDSENMSDRIEEIIERYNKILSEQRKKPYEVYVTTIFMHEDICITDDYVDIDDTEEMTDEEYICDYERVYFLEDMKKAFDHILMKQKEYDGYREPLHRIYVIMASGRNEGRRMRKASDIRKIIDEELRQGQDVLYECCSNTLLMKYLKGNSRFLDICINIKEWLDDFLHEERKIRKETTLIDDNEKEIEE